jgi:hypothetical protein
MTAIGSFGSSSLFTLAIVYVVTTPRMSFGAPTRASVEKIAENTPDSEISAVENNPLGSVYVVGFESA